MLAVDELPMDEANDFVAVDARAAVAQAFEAAQPYPPEPTLTFPAVSDNTKQSRLMSEQLYPPEPAFDEPQAKPFARILAAEEADSPPFHPVPEMDSLLLAEQLYPPEDDDENPGHVPIDGRFLLPADGTEYALANRESVAADKIPTFLRGDATGQGHPAEAPTGHELGSSRRLASNNILGQMTPNHLVIGAVLVVVVVGVVVGRLRRRTKVKTDQIENEGRSDDEEQYLAIP